MGYGEYGPTHAYCLWIAKNEYVSSTYKVVCGYFPHKNNDIIINNNEPNLKVTKQHLMENWKILLVEFVQRF